MKQFKTFLLLAVAFVLFIPATGCTTAAGPWRGTVLDSETKAPIEGAVVVAVWYRSHVSVGGPVERFEDARETLTDKDGKFEIPAYEYNPIFRDKTKPEFTIFKPGYGAFPVYNVTHENVIEMIARSAKDGTVFELPKLTDKKERLHSLNMMSLIGVPNSYVPKYYELEKKEQEYLGFKELR